MSEAAEAKKPGGGGAKSLAALLQGPVILTIANIAVVAVAMGFLVYSRFLYKKPVITEEGEREKIGSGSLKLFSHEAQEGKLEFGPLTVNIAPSNAQPGEKEGTRSLVGRLHYVTLAFTLSLRDSSKAEHIEALKPLIMDKLIFILGKKKYQELVAVQGRYLLRTQIMDFINAMVMERVETLEDEDPSEVEGLVTGVFFTDFVVQ